MAAGGVKRSPASPFEAQREAARRQALNAIRRARRQADKAGVELSAWEGEFLGSVAERVQTFGRAFGDPEKGAPGQALSGLQARKLKEIAAKAKGESEDDRAGARPVRSGFRRKAPRSTAGPREE